MHRFFVEPGQCNQNRITISGQDYNHIRNVLRMKIGEELLLSDGTDREYLCLIESFDTEKEQVLLQVADIIGGTRELPVKITLFQGYPKGDKLETIVQKAVELGVYEVVPVSMGRCVVKLDEKKALKKVERLNSIALSAAKQSKRGIIPKVPQIMTVDEACRYARTMDYLLLPYENAEGMEYSRKMIAQAGGKKHIGIFIGPEGGFEPAEVRQLEEIGAKTISLGHRILRTETAGMTVLSLLMFQLEND